MRKGFHCACQRLTLRTCAALFRFPVGPEKHESMIMPIKSDIDSGATFLFSRPQKNTGFELKLVPFLSNLFSSR